MLGRLNHVAIAVPDLAAGTAVYRSMLGAKVSDPQPEPAHGVTVVFVELPSAGDSFDRMQTFGTIEAVKAVSDLYCPVAAEIVEVNASLDDDPSLVNSDPYGAGWMIRIRVADVGDLGDLMDAEGYASHVGE